MLQYLSYQCLKPHWLWLEQVLEKYSQFSSCPIRQAACYGLGILSQQYPRHLKNAENAKEWADLLQSAYLIPRQKRESKLKYCVCRENIVGALGRVL